MGLFLEPFLPVLPYMLMVTLNAHPENTSQTPILAVLGT
jgi:hypothetical protein